MKRCVHRPESAQKFAGTCADKQVRLNKIIDAQALKDNVKCEGRQLKNVFKFKYLGSIFSADGSHEHDVKRRCAMAQDRLGALQLKCAAQTEVEGV